MSNSDNLSMAVVDFEAHWFYRKKRETMGEFGIGGRLQ